MNANKKENKINRSRTPIRRTYIDGTKADLNEYKAQNEMKWNSKKTWCRKILSENTSLKYENFWTIEADKPRSSISNFYYIAFVSPFNEKEEKKFEIQKKRSDSKREKRNWLGSFYPTVYLVFAFCTLFTVPSLPLRCFCTWIQKWGVGIMLYVRLSLISSTTKMVQFHSHLNRTDRLDSIRASFRFNTKYACARDDSKRLQKWFPSQKLEIQWLNRIMLIS